MIVDKVEDIEAYARKLLEDEDTDTVDELEFDDFFNRVSSDLHMKYDYPVAFDGTFNHIEYDFCRKHVEKFKVKPKKLSDGKFEIGTEILTLGGLWFKVFNISHFFKHVYPPTFLS